jgi:hypothetical protein
MNIKEVANRRIIIKAKYHLTENLELEMAKKVAIFKVFLKDVETIQLKGLNIEKGELSFGVVFENEARELRLYTIYIYIPPYMMVSPVYLAGGAKNIDGILEQHAKALKKNHRFVESAELIK